MALVLFQRSVVCHSPRDIFMSCTALSHTPSVHHTVTKIDVCPTSWPASCGRDLGSSGRRSDHVGRSEDTNKPLCTQYYWVLTSIPGAWLEEAPDAEDVVHGSSPLSAIRLVWQKMA